MALNSRFGDDPQIVFHAPISSAVKRALILQLLIKRICFYLPKKLLKNKILEPQASVDCRVLSGSLAQSSAFLTFFQKRKWPKAPCPSKHALLECALGASLWSIVAFQVATFLVFWGPGSLFGRSEAARRAINNHNGSKQR